MIAAGPAASRTLRGVSRAFSRVLALVLALATSLASRELFANPVFREERYFQTGSDFDWAKRTARMKRKKSFNHLMRRRKL